MRRNRVHAGVLALMGAAALGVAAASAARQTSGGAGNVIFFDDFASGSLDRTKWNVIVTGRVVNNEQQAYVDSTETLAFVRGAEAAGAENALAIRPFFRPGTK